MDRDDVRLHYGTSHGYLESLLGALNISRSSQVLVFSKTSLQTDVISPQTPRAIYFNDDTYIGWIPNSGLLEIVTMDADRDRFSIRSRTLTAAPLICSARPCAA